MSNTKKLFNINLKTVFSVICTLAILLSVFTSTIVTASAANHNPNAIITLADAKKAAKITKNQAKEIALNDAGLNGKRVLVLKQSLDADDGRAVYDIEFRFDSTKYEYEINAVNGSILDKSTEEVWSLKKAFEEFKNKILAWFGLAKTSKITVDQAKEIALKDAGVKASDARFLRQHLDNDDGVSVYDIEFISGNNEYEYEIKAADGKILDKSVERIGR